MDTVLVNGFFHWVTLYHGILTNLYGEDRDDALAVIDDDVAFDRWLANYNMKQAQASKTKPGSKRGGGSRISADEYEKRYAKVHD